MPDHLVEIRLILRVPSDLNPDIVLDDFIDDLTSVWRIEAMYANEVAAVAASGQTGEAD